MIPFFRSNMAVPQDPKATDRLLYTNFAIRRYLSTGRPEKMSYFEDVIVDFYGTALIFPVQRW